MSDFRPHLGQQPNTTHETVKGTKDEPALKGTFVSVMLLGAFIAVSWIGVFVLFMARN